MTVRHSIIFEYEVATDLEMRHYREALKRANEAILPKDYHHYKEKVQKSRARIESLNQLIEMHKERLQEEKLNAQT